MVILAACVFLAAGCNKSPTPPATSSASQPPPAPIQAEPFHGQVYKSLDGNTMLTLTSKDECELMQNGTTLLCKYTKQTDALRIVATVMGTPQVIYYRFTDQGIQDNNGKVLLSPEGLLEAQRQAQLARQAQQEAQAAAERQEAERQRLAAIAAQREAEEQRLADERAKNEAPEKFRALLTTRPALDGTYETGFGPTKLTLKVMSFNSGTASVSAEVDFPAAGYDGAHSNHAEGSVSGDTLNLTVFDSQEVTKRWMLMKLQFNGYAPPAHPTARLSGDWRNASHPEEKGGGLLFDLK